MIARAKASINAVKGFEMSASAVKDYSPKLDKGIDCLDILFQYLSECANKLRIRINEMSDAQDKLAEKIKDIEEILARLTAQLNDLEENLGELEGELADIPSTITRTYEDGESEEISNPEYEALCREISSVKSEIDAVKDEMYPHQKRLEHANAVDNQLTIHMDDVNVAVNSLELKKGICKQLRVELEGLQKLNLRQGMVAVDFLKKIESIISDYLKVKMKYESATLPQINQVQRQSDKNTIINNHTTGNEGEKIILQPTNTNKPEYSKEEISQHHIEFDDFGRVSVYDGKTFGGKYNTYDDRLARTPAADNPVNGRYEGLRGESKYIPSSRTTEGIVVKEILNHYGMDGITYRNGEPDFEECAESTVKILHMTANRENYINDEGDIVPGNFTQADVELAKVWILEQREGRNDWKARDVYDYRKANNLTWHEKCDMETMVLVRAEINMFFKHSGGCSECRVRDSGESNGGDFDE